MSNERRLSLIAGGVSGIAVLSWVLYFFVDKPWLFWVSCALSVCSGMTWAFSRQALAPVRAERSRQRELRRQSRRS